MIKDLSNPEFRQQMITAISKLITGSKDEYSVLQHAEQVLDAYIVRTNHHIWLVNQCAGILKDTVAAAGQDTELFLLNAEYHDYDKLHDPDIIPSYSVGCDIFYESRNRAKYTVDKKHLMHLFENVSWPKHHFQNAHHVAEHFGKLVDGVYVVPKIDNYLHLAEMIADWMAVGILRGNSANDWWKKIKDKKCKFDPTDVDIIESLLKVERESVNQMAYLRQFRRVEPTWVPPVESIPAKEVNPIETNEINDAIENFFAVNKNNTISKQPDVLYHGSPKKLSLIQCNHARNVNSSNKIFASPYKGIASCFVINPQTVVDQLQKQFPNCTHISKINMGFDVWEKELSALSTVATNITIFINLKQFTPFSGIAEGYIHKIDANKYEDNIKILSERELTIDTDVVPLTAQKVSIKWTCVPSTEKIKRCGYEAVIHTDDTKSTSSEVLISSDVHNFIENFFTADKTKISTSIETLNSIEINNVGDLVAFYQSSNYGTVIDGVVYTGNKLTGSIIDKAHMLTVKEQLRYKVGTCYDTVGMSHYYLSKWNIPHQMFLQSVRKQYDATNGIWDDPTHTFLIYKDGDVWNWLEGSWGKYMHNNLSDADPNKLVATIVDLLRKEKQCPIYIRELKTYPALGQSVHTFYKQMMESNIYSSVETMLLLTKTPEERQLTELAKPLYVPVGMNSWQHIQQVVGNASDMVKGVYHRSLSLMEYAVCLFHDCSVMRRHNKDRHAYWSAELAKSILSTTTLFNDKELAQIYQAIFEHDDETNPSMRFSSDLSDLLASGDFNPPNIAWILNKSYAWGIRHGYTHEERLTNTLNTIAKKYGSHGTAVYPKLYKLYHKSAITKMQTFFDHLTRDVCERVVMDYRKRHHLIDDDMTLPDPSLESLVVPSEEFMLTSTGNFEDTKEKQLIRKLVNSYYAESGSHGWNHINEVLTTAELLVGRKLALGEYAAIVCHDLGRKYMDDGHNVKSTEIAKTILPKTHLFTEEELEEIYLAILEHCGSWRKKNPPKNNKPYSSALSELVACADKGLPMTTIEELYTRPITWIFEGSDKGTPAEHEYDISDNLSIANRVIRQIKNWYGDCYTKACSSIDMYSLKFKDELKITQRLANTTTANQVLPLIQKLRTSFGVESYPSQEAITMKRDDLYIGPIDPMTIDFDKLYELASYPSLLLALKKWTTTPNRDLMPELIELGKIVDKLYQFKKPIKCYRGIRTGFSLRPPQNLMGAIDDEFRMFRMVKANFRPGHEFEFETPEPMSVTRAPFLAKVYGDFIVKVELTPEVNKLVITNELSYLLQQMEVEYPQYRPVNLSVVHECIVFPGQKLTYTVVSTYGDISSEMDTLSAHAFESINLTNLQLADSTAAALEKLCTYSDLRKINKNAPYYKAQYSIESLNSNNTKYFFRTTSGDSPFSVGSFMTSQGNMSEDYQLKADDIVYLTPSLFSRSKQVFSDTSGKTRMYALLRPTKLDTKTTIAAGVNSAFHFALKSANVELIEKFKQAIITHNYSDTVVSEFIKQHKQSKHYTRKGGAYLATLAEYDKTQPKDAYPEVTMTFAEMKKLQWEELLPNVESNCYIGAKSKRKFYPEHPIDTNSMESIDISNISEIEHCYNGDSAVTSDEIDVSNEVSTTTSKANYKSISTEDKKKCGKYLYHGTHRDLNIEFLGTHVCKHRANTNIKVPVCYMYRHIGIACLHCVPFMIGHGSKLANYQEHFVQLDDSLDDLTSRVKTVTIVHNDPKLPPVSGTRVGYIYCVNKSDCIDDLYYATPNKPKDWCFVSYKQLPIAKKIRITVKWTKSYSEEFAKKVKAKTWTNESSVEQLVYDNAEVSTEATSISSDQILQKKTKIINYICAICDLMDPSKLNSKRYHRLLDHMDAKEFDQWMNYVKEGKWRLHIVAPNLIVNLKNENLLKAADKAKCKLFHKIWLTDAATGRQYLTDNEYIVVTIPVRRQQQFLDEKMSVPDNDRQIDGMTGQVTGDSRACSITNPEIQILAARKLDATLEEFVNVRGGNIAAYSEFKRQAEETGEISLNTIQTGSVARSAMVGQVLLRSMMIDNNIVE